EADVLTLPRPRGLELALNLLPPCVVRRLLEGAREVPDLGLDPPPLLLQREGLVLEAVGRRLGPAHALVLQREMPEDELHLGRPAAVPLDRLAQQAQLLHDGIAVRRRQWSGLRG